MYLVYFDDSVAKRQDINWQILTAVIINGQRFDDAERLVGFAVENWLPEDQWDKFQEFKAAELFNRKGVFSALTELNVTDIFEHFTNLVEGQEAVIIYGAVDPKKFDKSLYGSINTLELAFRLCVFGVEEWLRRSGDDLAIVIHDSTNDSTYKTAIQTFFRDHRKRLKDFAGDRGTLAHLHDDIYFADSKFSVGVQLADICGYIINRHLCGQEDVEGLYSILEKRIFSSRKEPSVDLPAWLFNELA